MSDGQLMSEQYVNKFAKISGYSAAACILLIVISFVVGNIWGALNSSLNILYLGLTAGAGILLTGLAALPLGLIGIGQIRHSHNAQSGYAFAISGIVVGIGTLGVIGLWVLLALTWPSSGS